MVTRRVFPRARVCTMQTFDTHATIQDLEAAGIKPEHAEAIVKTVNRADTQLATRADLAMLEGRIASLEYRLAAAGCRLGPGVVVANGAIVFGLLKLVPPTQACPSAPLGTLPSSSRELKSLRMRHMPSRNFVGVCGRIGRRTRH